MRDLGRCLGVLCLAVAAMGAGTGCGSGYGSYCEDAMGCEGGNELDTEACELALTREEDLADLEGCADQWAEYFDCANEEARCVNNDFTTVDRCRVEADRLDSCMD